MVDIGHIGATTGPSRDVEQMKYMIFTYVSILDTIIITYLRYIKHDLTHKIVTRVANMYAIGTLDHCHGCIVYDGNDTNRNIGFDHADDVAMS